MKTIIIFLTLAALVLSSCSILPNRDFNAAQFRWQNSHLSHYRYTIHVGCFCAFMDTMPLTIEVANGAVQSMSYSDGSPVPPDQLASFARYSTIEAVFSLTADALHRADEVKVAYDRTYGFPSTVQIDYMKDAVDDELALSVTSFQPLP
jgi:hypothetical protein